MDVDSTKLIRILYLRQSISKAEAAQIDLRCNPDAFFMLQSLQIVLDQGANWQIAPSVSNFINYAEGNLDHFPLQNWIFRDPLDRARQDSSCPECFVAMPYGTEWFADVARAITSGAESAGYRATIAKNFVQPGNIMEQVWSSVRHCRVVIADATNTNANVFYEIGLAHALGKRVVLLNQTNALPFDIQSERYLVYDRSNLDALTDGVRTALAAVED